MQEITIPPGATNFQLTQISPRPWIYLDHWALREFSSNQELGKKFIDLLVKKEGTLCISWMNIFEVTNHIEGESLNSILNFYERLGNRFSYIQCNPVKVIQNENQYQPGNQNPGLDTELAIFYLKYIYGKEFKLISLRQVIKDLIRKNDIHVGMREGLERAKQSLQQEFSKYRQRYLINPKDLSSKKPLKTPRDVTPYIFSETLKQYIKGNSKIEQNDVPDIFHAVVPVSYCDFVLLDSKWATLVKNTHPKKGVAAEIYSKREINDFWIDLEEFTTRSIGYPFEQHIST